VLPLETLGKSVPWLALDKNAPPVSNIVGFNTLRPPFNSPTIRQAFAHAIDREVIAGMAAKYGTRNIGPATTLTPPVTLGRDLYNEVGAVFDPQAAKDLLIEAGYTDPSSFPVVTIVVNASGDVRPGARFNMATAMAGMWKEYLGVTVQVEAIGSWKAYGERLRSNPPEMFWLGWAADYNDPDDFLRVIFHSDSEYNSGKFSNDEYDRLVNRARIGDPAARQELYIRAERLLTETEAALIPLYYTVK
jgi:ABC-type oligopeptide transport system substrate-binding subunit